MVYIQQCVVIAAITSYVCGLSLIPGVSQLYNQALSAFQVSGNDLEFPAVINVFPNPDEKPVPGDSPISQCDISQSQILSLNKVIVTPNPPARGENLTFLAEGVLAQDIEDGAYVDVDVRYGFIKLLHQTFDLCDEIENVGLECPIKKGPQTIQKEVQIPNEVPPGRYIVYARAYTKDDEFITCLTATVDFLPE
jgi:hypothetical protein